MAKDTETSGEKAAALAIFVFVLPITIWLRPHVAILIYEWHVRPIFGGPAFSWVQAFMAMAFVQFVNGGYMRTQPKSDDSNELLPIVGKMFGWGIVWPALCLLIAWWLK